ncbi:hypothetical protein PR202_ga26633 [Eleusine coracana subsp. coracana]|uniref:Uncharacterized protein n=1 Tax=Eleusine coracana subsp. coracana TaxID=191504 RepID=A0AAV5DCE1_ELECO|nr:hypothetical protein PR202_ga26633 [Eleusine coracana subsp. coracana]
MQESITGTDERKEGERATSLLALAERLLAVLMHDLEQRFFQVLLPTCSRGWLGSGHPVPSPLPLPSQSPAVVGST